MTDHIHIRLYRTATNWQWSVTHWQWSVDNDGDCDDFVFGGSSDYVKACAEALAAYDRMIAAERGAP